jgi:hypothetical protein
MKFRLTGESAKDGPMRLFDPWAWAGTKKTPQSIDPWANDTLPACAHNTRGHALMALLRTTSPWITRSAPFPPVSSRGARSCRRPDSLPISTTEETHETQDVGLGLWPLSLLCNMKGCTCSLYRDVRPLRSKAGICPHNPN